MKNRINYIKVFVRFSRQIKPTWNRVLSEIADECRWDIQLDHRKGIIDQYLNQQPTKKLQLGAGTNYLQGWLNSDSEPMSDQVIFLDATKRFPFDSNVLDYVFSEHMIEHISYKQGIAMMREIYRVLKPGGKVRIATPDIEKIVGLLLPQKTVDQKHYIKWKAVDYMGLYSPEPSQLQKRREEWDIDFRHIQHYYPNVEADGACFIVNNFFRGYGHQFLYDIRSLMAITKEAGFIEPRIFKPNESDDIHLSHLESHANLIGNDMNNFETMVLQAVHP